MAVTFALENQVIQTLEGPVSANLGDAVVTGVAGECWPITATDFSKKYAPAQRQAAGEPGIYVKRPHRVEAYRLAAAADVDLGAGRGWLKGQPGDWLVRYCGGDTSIVRHDIFTRTYQLASIPVFFTLGISLSPAERASVRAAMPALQTLIPHTPLVEVTGLMPDAPIWFSIDATTPSTSECIPEFLQLCAADITGAEIGNLAAALKEQTRKQTVFGFTRQALNKLVRKLDLSHEGAAALQTLAAQLASVARFNQSLAEINAAGQARPPSDYFERADPSDEPAGLDRCHDIGMVSDSLANEGQQASQTLIFATATELSRVSGAFAFLRLLFRPSLISLGLVAAAGLSAYTELSGGCDAGDPFAMTGCASQGWKNWFGPAAFVIVYIGALTWGWIRYASAKIRRNEAQHQDCRLLAECLRVRYVRRLLRCDLRVANDLPLAEHTESGWVRRALQGIEYAQPDWLAETAPQRALDTAKRIFVTPQLLYHRVHLIEWREKALAVLGLAAALGMAAFIGSILLLFVEVSVEVLSHGHSLLSSMGHHLAVVALILSLLFWASMRKAKETLGLEPEIQRGRILLHVLAQAVHADCDGLVSATQAYVTDQAAWHALHRGKPLEAATGG